MDTILLTPPKVTDSRRSQRVLLAVKILISGDKIDGQPFTEETMTSVVNAHGALILLTERVYSGRGLTIRNVQSGEECSCTVIDIGEKEKEKARVGVRFLEPSSRFWGIAFPPVDWSPRGPESKRYSGATPFFMKPKSSN